MSQEFDGCVVFLKTHTWDDFVVRQVARLEAVTTHPVVVLLDQTSGARAAGATTEVLGFDQQELLDLGLLDLAEKGGLIWWNTDYPNYLARLRYPSYEHYVFVEYDAAVTTSLDEVVAEVRRRRIDLVALPTREDPDTWHWTRFHLGAYPREEMRQSLNCVSILSARAVDMMFARRLEMAADHAAGRITFWPMNEIFLATEAARAGYTFASLAEFGAVDAYEWHPPIVEDDLPAHEGGFVHPVLDRPRYIASALRYEFDLTQFFRPRGRLWRSLRRFPTRQWLPQFPRAFVDGFRRMLLAKTGHI